MLERHYIALDTAKMMVQLEIIDNIVKLEDYWKSLTIFGKIEGGIMSGFY